MAQVLKKTAACLVLLAGLAACDAPTSIKAAPGQSVDQVVRSITVTRGIAVAISLWCRSEGIGLRTPNIKASVEQDVRNLLAQGYPLEDIKAAFRRNNGDKSLVRAGVSYLQERGVRQGDIASLCAVGKSEMRQGTAVGKLLKRI